MSRSAPPSSILELLTCPNPVVVHQDLKPNLRSNTRNHAFIPPKQLKKWDEFQTFDLREAFGGSLMEAARRPNDDLPVYPHIDREIDCDISDEGETLDLLHKWNRSVVNGALKAIEHQFRPAFWMKRKKVPDRREQVLPDLHAPQRQRIRTQPPRKSSTQARQSPLLSLSRLRSDSGSDRMRNRRGSADSGLAASDTGHRDLFPKEYKPATKWDSMWINQRGLLNEAGELYETSWGKNAIQPIKQAYTYCIKSMSRYGCILTCKEAFLFRVRPRDAKPGDVPVDAKSLRKSLITNGLMEYVSIPWDEPSQECCTQSRQTWTINLALWYMHILAGNNFEINWDYGRLQDEAMFVSTTPDQVRSEGAMVSTPDVSQDYPQQHEEAETGTTSTEFGEEPSLASPAKRKREPEAGEEEEEEDIIHTSFTKKPKFGRSFISL